MYKNEELSLGLVLALSKSMAKRYGSIGIKSIVVNDTGDGVVITLNDETVFSVVFSDFMSRSVYDTINDGQIATDNSRKLNNQEPVYYLGMTNFPFTTTVSEFVGVANAKEIVDLLIDKTHLLLMETENNNIAIHNVVKGDYLTTDSSNLLSLDKSIQGVVINATKIKEALDHVDVQITSVSNTISELMNKTKIIEANVVTIIGLGGSVLIDYPTGFTKNNTMVQGFMVFDGNNWHSPNFNLTTYINGSDSYSLNDSKIKVTTNGIVGDTRRVRVALTRSDV